MQAFSRSLFALHIPEGLESQFYALFSFTDRGSSWIGPAIVSTVIQTTGSIRLAFVYPLVALCLPSLLMLAFVDPAAAEADAKRYAKRYDTAAGVRLRGGISVVDEEGLTPTTTTTASPAPHVSTGGGEDAESEKVPLEAAASPTA